MTKLMDGKDGISINMPCAPMPVSAGEAADFMHPRLVTYLTGIPVLLYKGRTHTSLDKERILLEESSSGHSQCGAAIQALH